MKDKPIVFLKKARVLSFYASVAIGFAVYFFFGLDGKAIMYGALATLVGFFLVFMYFYNSPTVYIAKHRKAIDGEVLFAGRFLLIKLESGVPLFNALIDASKSYGGIGRYFKEIIDEIDLGTPLERALENGREYNPSEKFRWVLWTIVTSMKTGIDATKPLRSTLEEITREEEIGIKEYSKKLNSLIMFYMIMACVVPSLGVAILIIVSSFVDLGIGFFHLMAIVVVLTFMQMMFIIMIKSIRPTISF